MIDLNSPSSDFKTYFKDQHETFVINAFEELARRSGVSETENIKTVAELRRLEQEYNQGSASRKKWRWIRIAVLLTVFALVVLAVVENGPFLLLTIPALGLIIFLVRRVTPEINKLGKSLKVLSENVSTVSNQAWSQMAPLNALQTWTLAPQLVQKTIPDFEFDRYFTARRLEDLQRNFDLSSEVNNGLSIIAAQSGAFRGNPFVLARYKRHWMGSRVYSGTLVIQWVERVRDSNGNWVNQTRTQTLVARVQKPYPEYEIVSKLIYGHEAAPNLSFSRNPSKLTSSNGGEISRKKIDKAIKKVERKARKDLRTGNGELTLMANREFEAIFNAVDRNNEIEFRLLFTPIAQQEIVELLTDSNLGYGDDFSFAKTKRLNWMGSRHLSNTRFNDDPSMFHSLDFKEAKKFFINFHRDYFRSIYFAFAPLWSIPLYREPRSTDSEMTASSESACSDWEHEVMANFIGQSRFKHPESATENIVRAYARTSSNSTNIVDVVTYGYSAHSRVDFVPVLGGDGNWHSVPVHWTEYIPVAQNSTIMVGAVKSPNIEIGDTEDLTMRDQWDLNTREVPSNEVFSRNGVVAVVLG